jgi:hypothetical protein
MEYIFLFIAGYGLRIVKTRMNGEQLHQGRTLPAASRTVFMSEVIECN